MADLPVSVQGAITRALTDKQMEARRLRALDEIVRWGLTEEERSRLNLRPSIESFVIGGEPDEPIS